MSPEARKALKDDMLLTVDFNFDPEPETMLKHEDFIKRMLNNLDRLCAPPYELEFRWKVALVRNNKNLIELLRILSLDRFAGNGER